MTEAITGVTCMSRTSLALGAWRRYNYTFGVHPYLRNDALAHCFVLAVDCERSFASTVGMAVVSLENCQVCVLIVQEQQLEVPSSSFLRCEILYS